MINLIDEIIKKGRLHIDETHRVTIELINMCYKLSNIYIDPYIYSREEESIYFNKNGKFNEWKDFFYNIQNFSTRRLIWTDNIGCVSMIQALFRDNMVHLNVNMRSADVYNKLFVNLASFEELQMDIARRYDYSVGDININFGSMHIFLSDILNFNHGKCIRRDNSSVVIKDGSIIGLEVNRCALYGDCRREKGRIPHGERIELCNGSHAEILAMFDAMRNTDDLHGSSVYAKDSPCSLCASYAYHMGIDGFYYLKKGMDEAGKMGRNLMDKKGVKHGYFR